MGSNRFLNSEGQDVDISELLNEINALSEEVEGKLDKDGTDGGMTGNLDINANSILLGAPAVGALDSVGGNTTLFQTDNTGDLTLISTRDVIIGATNEIKSTSILNMNQNNINNVLNINSASSIILNPAVASSVNINGNVDMGSNNIIGVAEVVGDGSDLTIRNGGGESILLNSATNTVDILNNNLNMGGNEINNCSNLISIQSGASIISESGSSGGSITYQNFTRVGNSIEATIRYTGTIVTSNSAITLAVPRASSFTTINQASGVASIGDVNGVNTQNFSSFNIKSVVGNPWVEMSQSIGGLAAGTRTINFKFNYLA